MSKPESGNTLSVEKAVKRFFTKITAEDLIISVICFMLSGARLLNMMTPFGIAFFAASFSNRGWFYAMLAASAGSIFNHAGADSARYIITLGLTASVMGLFDIKKKTFLKAFTVSFIHFSVSLLLLSAGDFELYSFIIQSFESFVCFVSVYLIDSVAPVIINYRKRTFLNHNEVMGIITLVALFILSLSSAPDIFGLSPAPFVTIFIIMAISYRGNIMISSCAGIILGLALALSGDGSASVVGAYALASFMAGVFRRYSRLGIVLGVSLANAVVTAFMNDSSIMLINPVEVFIAGMIFATMPKKTADVFSDFAKKAADVSSINNTRAEKQQIMKEEKLSHMSDAFKKIADIYRRDCQPRRPGKQYITRLFDYTGEKTCATCGLRFGCWQSDKRNTYAYMASMLEKTADKGTLTTDDLPRKFADKCVRREEFVKNFNFMYDIYKTDKLWLEKMREARQLMVNQMEGTSQILESASADSVLISDSECEMHLRSALDAEGIQAENVYVLLKDGEIFRAGISCSEHIKEEQLAQIASEALEIPMRSCAFTSSDNGISCEICPCENYIIQWASAFSCKSGEEICGDSHEALGLDGGKAVMVISDGMGSGEEAYEQSRDTVDMLSCFLRAGFEPKNAFELINSSLLLRSAKDCFSTIDMMSADLNTGMIQLFKIGAAPTYVKQDDKVRYYDCSTLPVGILRDIQPQTAQFEARDHTMIVMMSDGISNTVIKKQEDWIEKELKNLKTHNPRVAASRLLDKAIRENGGRIDDDMTVAVAVIYKK